MAKEAGDTVRLGPLELRFLVDEGNLVMFEFTIPPSAQVPVRHYHVSVDEVVYGISGTTTTSLNGEKHELRAGQSLLIPRGSVHTHENLHEVPAKSLIVMTPGTIGRSYFEEIAAAVKGPEKPDPAKLKEIMLRYGLVPA
ncbi:MAG: cupin domain-containing protein [Rhizobiales bacterium]|nr:cupin domain-containing protein [Hyphomicrobiales bacterium]